MISSPSPESSPQKTYRLMAGAAVAIGVLLCVAIFSFSKIETLPWARELRDPAIQVSNRKNMPAFEAAGNGLLSPEALSGRWTLVSFWSVTCAPCLEELPAMNQLALGWQGPPFQIVTVNLDATGANSEDLEAARQFLQEQDISLPTIFDEGGRLKKAFAVTEYPKHFLVDPKGQIVWEELGSFAWNSGAARDQLIKLMEKQTLESDRETAE